MSVITKSTLVYPERQGTTFRAEDEINFYIPPSLSLLNTKSTCLLFDLNMTGLLKKSVSLSAGVAGLFQSITVMSGDGNTVYETLDSYGIQHAIYYYYTKIAGNHLRELHEGKPTTVVFGMESANQYCNGLATDSSAHKKVEVMLPLYLVGCLSPVLRDKVFPLVATQGLRLRIVLSTVERGTQVIKSPCSADSTTGQPASVDPDATRNEAGGYQVAFQASQSNATNNLVVDRIRDNTRVQFNGVKRAIVWNKNGASATPKVAHPFMVGQTISGSFAGSPRKITGISQNADGQILLTCDGAAFVGLTGVSVLIDTSSANNPDENYEINNLRLQVSYAVANPEYLSAIQRSVAAGKMTIDIRSWTDYAQNIAANSLENSMYIKSVNNRAHSIISTPIKVGSAVSLLEDSYIADQQGIRAYQYILYNVLTPNKQIQLGRFVKMNGDAKASADGAAVKEMSHAIVASNYPLNNIKYPWRQFFIGRKLANKGYSMNLNAEGDVRLSVSYDSIAAATLFHNCVHHTRRITVQGNQQTVTL